MEVPSARLRLRVVPGARRAGMVGRPRDAWRVSVTAPRERGKATEQALALLADALGVPPAHVRLVAGRRSRDKLVELWGLKRDEADALLAEAST